MRSQKKPRETRQRHAIRDALDKTGRPLSPMEILKIASKEVSQMGIATVYRNVKMMLEAGELEAVDIPGQPPRYQYPREGEGHLFIDEERDQVHWIEPKLSSKELNLPRRYRAKRVQVICYGEVRGEEKSKTPARRAS